MQNTLFKSYDFQLILLIYIYMDCSNHIFCVVECFSETQGFSASAPLSHMDLAEIHIVESCWGWETWF